MDDELTQLQMKLLLQPVSVSGVDQQERPNIYVMHLCMYIC